MFVDGEICFVPSALFGTSQKLQEIVTVHELTNYGVWQKKLVPNCF